MIAWNVAPPGKPGESYTPEQFVEVAVRLGLSRPIAVGHLKRHETWRIAEWLRLQGWEVTTETVRPSPPRPRKP